MKRFSSVLLASVLLSSCSGVIGGPQVSIEEIRTSYDVEEESLLIAAVKSGNLKHVKVLIKAGFDVNVKDNSSDTPLHYAAREGNLEIAQELIKAGADVNLKSGPFYTTPLAVAKRYGFTEIVNLLIENGATE